MLNVVLTEEFESYIAGKVASGLYQSADEVIRDGLRLLKKSDDLHHRQLDDLRRDLAIGIDQADANQTHPFDEDVTARVRARGRARLAPRGELDHA